MTSLALEFSGFPCPLRLRWPSPARGRAGGGAARRPLPGPAPLVAALPAGPVPAQPVFLYITARGGRLGPLPPPGCLPGTIAASAVATSETAKFPRCRPGGASSRNCQALAAENGMRLAIFRARLLPEPAGEPRARSRRAGEVPGAGPARLGDFGGPGRATPWAGQPGPPLRCYAFSQCSLSGAGIAFTGDGEPCVRSAQCLRTCNPPA